MPTDRDGKGVEKSRSTGALNVLTITLRCGIEAGDIEAGGFFC